MKPHEPSFTNVVQVCSTKLSNREKVLLLHPQDPSNPRPCCNILFQKNKEQMLERGLQKSPFFQPDRLLF